MSLGELLDGFRQLPASPREAGSLDLIVLRLADGGRDRPTEARLTCEEGVVGDAWSVRPPRDPLCQITVMQRNVAELIANRQPLTLFGDNLFVSLDISAGNLPPGSRLRVGGAMVEVTPEPHTGCSIFKRRFGFDALKFSALKDLRENNLRGVHWRVIEPGVVRPGDAVTVVARARGDSVSASVEPGASGAARSARRPDPV